MSTNAPTREDAERAYDEAADAIEAVVEVGRTVLYCGKHERNVWCSCKVRDLAARMVAMGWEPPRDGRSDS